MREGVVSVVSPGAYCVSDGVGDFDGSFGGLFYRDVRHLLNIGLLVWFWATPIVYASGFVQATLTGYSAAGVTAFDLYMLNPLASVVGAVQRALYGVVDPSPSPSDPTVLFDVGLGWLTGIVGIVLVVSLGLLWFAWRTFFRLSGDFAEEL